MNPEYPYTPKPYLGWVMRNVFMGVDKKRAESSTTIIENTKELVEKQQYT